MHRIEVGFKQGVRDAAGERTARLARENLGIALEGVKTIEVYNIDDGGILGKQETEFLAREVFADSVVNEFSVDGALARESEFDFAVEVGFKPGVTDNAGKTAKQAIEDALKKKIDGVYSGRQYLLKGRGLTADDADGIARKLLSNGLVEEHFVRSSGEWNGGFAPRAPKVVLLQKPVVAEIDLSVGDEKLMEISRKGLLALSLEEMKEVRKYFEDGNVREERGKVGLGEKPTDAEIEAIAQTWSEHCKHKIFNALVEYEDAETGEKLRIDSLFKTFVKETTRKTSRDSLVSVFSDNAGIVEFDAENNFVVKVETHNAPSALDPYGGALTGIVGVNRDVMGAGLGARMVFNTDVFCFGPPEVKVPDKIIAPKRIFEGVRRGVEHGGNKSGIPTVNGAIVFDERFAYRPLVYCGTGGIMPKKTFSADATHEKKIPPGHLIVMCGGRIGKDGIHGATFSSVEVSEKSPATAVQLGDPITQKQMADFLLEARDAGCYSAITDNGAGGLSSSVGEMAQLSGGFVLRLDRAPLKYPGLQPWEILVSESQERMTIAVPPEKLGLLEKLARKHEVESSVLGEFTDSGKFHCTHDGKTVAFLDMSFVHAGVPQMRLKAKWKKPERGEPEIPEPLDYNAALMQILSRYNVCSKEYVVRQYDHEVQGGSAVKPLTGADNDGPSDAGVVRPLLGAPKAIVIANGICPKYSDVDAGAMAECAVDEALRNYLCVGGRLASAAGLDNFSWCDPLPSATNPEAEFKLGQLVRACKAMHDACVSYGIPLVSGKDSMKNDYVFPDGKRVSIPPTLLFTVVGTIEDAGKAVTMDAKKAGDLVYALGLTRKELGGSEYYAMHSAIGESVPRVDAKNSIGLYRGLEKAICAGLASSCHDCSDGGLGVALAETAFAGGLGMRIELAGVPREAGLERSDFVLFSESHGRFVVTVAREKAEDFETSLDRSAFAKIGEVTAEKKFVVFGTGGQKIIDCGIEELKLAWKKPLDW